MVSQTIGCTGPQGRPQLLTWVCMGKCSVSGPPLAHLSHLPQWVKMHDGAAKEHACVTFTLKDASSEREFKMRLQRILHSCHGSQSSVNACPHLQVQDLFFPAHPQTPWLRLSWLHKPTEVAKLHQVRELSPSATGSPSFSADGQGSTWSVWRLVPVPPD
jgi:hypothetical protein